MISIEIAGTRARITGLGGELLASVREATSYKRSGAMFSAMRRGLPWEQAKKLSGLTPLLKWAPQSGQHTLPAGLLSEVLAISSDYGERVVVRDSRPPLPSRRDFGFEAPMRRYQLEAALAFAQGTGAGILKHSVRSGKTRTAARIIAAYGVPSLFVVTSQILMRQAHEVLSGLLTKASVTCVGEGSKDASGDVVVCTIQALLRARTEKTRVWQSLALRPLVVSDETHHYERAEQWVNTLLNVLARIRLGLSATVWPNPNAHDPEDVFLKACTGPVVSEVTMSDLMGQGYLVPCTVRTRVVREPKKHRSQSYAEAKISCLYENPVRNAAVVEEVIRAHEEGYRGIIVTTNRVKHARELAQMLTDAGMESASLVGEHADNQRKDVIGKLCAGRIDAVVSTVLGEGVDIPECEAVVVAEGGESRRAALQRMRCLTPFPGKTRSLLVDFDDRMNAYLESHSESRRWAYDAEKCFSAEET